MTSLQALKPLEVRNGRSSFMSDILIEFCHKVKTFRNIISFAQVLRAHEVSLCGSAHSIILFKSNRETYAEALTQ